MAAKFGKGSNVLPGLDSEYIWLFETWEKKSPAFSDCKLSGAEWRHFLCGSVLFPASSHENPDPGTTRVFMKPAVLPSGGRGAPVSHSKSVCFMGAAFFCNVLTFHIYSPNVFRITFLTGLYAVHGKVIFNFCLLILFSNCTRYNFKMSPTHHSITQFCSNTIIYRVQHKLRPALMVMIEDSMLQETTHSNIN